MTDTEFDKEVLEELASILRYWTKYTLDEANGGFIGRIDNHGNVYPDAPKGIILNTRILWTFSRACNFYKTDAHGEYANRAYSYLREHFDDPKYGGVFWKVSATGEPRNKKKQIYAQAFCIYALSEFYKYSQKEEALDWALQLFELIEYHAHEKVHGGYLEAFSEDWSPIEDLRLSEKDHNEPKTANTHLHILEAYTTLYEVSGNKEVEQKLKGLIHVFSERILDAKTNHLGLFFTLDWKETSGEISYGHDIETGWLILYAAQILRDRDLIKQKEQELLAIADTFLNEGLDKDFGVLNNKTIDKGIDADKHWWPQIEAMVGLAYAWKVTKNPDYLESAKKIWAFTKTNIIDRTHGEWFFRVDQVGKPYMEENKVGPWKCPYHNGRGLMEVALLLDDLT